MHRSSDLALRNTYDQIGGHKSEFRSQLKHGRNFFLILFQKALIFQGITWKIRTITGQKQTIKGKVEALIFHQHNDIAAS